MPDTKTGLFDDSYLPSEVAKILGVHVDTVRKWAKEGKLEYTTIQRGARTCRVFSKKHIDDLAERKKQRDEIIPKE